MRAVSAGTGPPSRDHAASSIRGLTYRSLARVRNVHMREELSMEYQPLDEDIQPLDHGPHDLGSSATREDALTGEPERTRSAAIPVDPSGVVDAEAGGEQKTDRVSARQLEANRENAKRSTGPRTAPGKKTSSQNAIKHGYYADGAEPIQRGALAEDPEEFDRRTKEIIASMRARSVVAGELARTIASGFNTHRRLEHFAALQLSNDGKADDLTLVNEHTRLRSVYVRGFLDTLRSLLWENTHWENVDGEGIARRLLDEKNGGKPVALEGIWDSDHQPETEEEWRTAAKLLLERLFPEGVKQALKWVNQLDFDMWFDGLRVEGIQQELAARRAVETLAHTIPKSIAVQRQLVRSLDAYRHLHEDELAEEGNPPRSDEDRG